MKDVGVVLRVPEEIHSKLKSACAKHDRSMQKVVVTLIEGWVANGSPEPNHYGRNQVLKSDEAAIDHEARTGLGRLGEAFKKLSERVRILEDGKIRRASADQGMKELFELIEEEEAKNRDRNPE